MEELKAVIETKDYYFSKNAFKALAMFSTDIVCEAFISGEWRIFTEQIPVGKEPLSFNWGDLQFIGTSDQRRYTRYDKWMENNQR